MKQTRGRPKGTTKPNALPPGKYVRFAAAEVAKIETWPGTTFAEKLRRAIADLPAMRGGRRESN